MPFEDLIRVVVIFLLPMAPAVLLFYQLPPQRIEAEINGIIKGISFKAGGATAMYILFVFVASYLYNQVTGTNVSYIDGGIKVRLIGDRVAIEEFKTKVRSDIEVSFVNNNRILATHAGFRLDPYKDIITSWGFRFDRKYIGETASIQIDPFNANFSVDPKEVTFEEGELAITIALSNETGGDWIAPIDLSLWRYAKNGRSLNISTLHLLDNRTGGVLSNVQLNPLDVRYLGSGPINGIHRSSEM